MNPEPLGSDDGTALPDREAARINSFASDPATQDGIHGWPRIGRQFYDVWALLGTREVLDFLADNALVGEVLASCDEIPVLRT